MHDSSSELFCRILRSKHPYLPIPVIVISCSAPSTVRTAFLVPLAVGLKINQTAQFAPAPMVRPQLLAWVKSDESFPAILMSEIVNAAGVLLVMTTLKATLSVPTFWSGKKIAVRDNPTLGAGSAGEETCHQVPELLGASEFFQFAGLPEPSNTEGNTPRVAPVEPASGAERLADSARIGTEAAATSTLV
jgi:hypothetical protein